MINTDQSLLLFELLRASIFGGSPVIDDPSKIQWDGLSELSAGQGVLAFVWDSICKLPKELQPSRQDRINWALSAQKAWDRYEKQKSVLSEMVKVCDANGLRLLLLKGNSLAQLYPKPESRPSGDIDVFFFGEYDKGNSLLAQSEIHENKKHAEFTYRGVTIENHRTFINPSTPRLRRIEQLLEKSLTEAQRSSFGYYELPTESAFLFYLLHGANHFRYDSVKSFTIRQVMDIVLFLLKNEQAISPDRCKELAKLYHLAYYYDLVVALGADILHVDMNAYRLRLVPNVDFQRAYQLLLRVDTTENGTFGHQLCSSIWKQKYLPEGNNKFIELKRRVRLQLLTFIRVLFGIQPNESVRTQMLRKKQ